jgi:predicted esterase
LEFLKLYVRADKNRYNTLAFSQNAESISDAKVRAMRFQTIASVVIILVGFGTSLHAQPTAWWNKEVEAALVQAKANRAELEKALNAAPKEQRIGIAFLVANMPVRDLASLKADFLLKNLDLAYKARATMPWGNAVPEALFLNDVLPYASVTETREAWRQEMMDLCVPIVKDCKTLTEAAQALNAALFNKLKVKYSTQRNRPDQSPSESIKTGMASCTGLSILLIDACRSVGVPARIVGIPKWVNKPGNHMWVEVWDGDWHFTGACEHDKNGLNRTWFVGDAALAKKDSVLNAIYASSYKRTATTFPLVWDPRSKEVFAENVTERYTRAKKAAAVTRLMIRVWEPGKMQRASVTVKLIEADDAGNVRTGASRGETADTNDLLTFMVPHKKAYVVHVGEQTRRIATEERETLIVEIELPTQTSLSGEQRKQIYDAARDYFDAGKKPDAKFDALLLSHEKAVREIAWQAYAGAKRHADLKTDFDAKVVKHENHASAYTVKFVGKKPKAGWPLFIAMHGGGNAPKKLNDSQWAIMQKYYKDQDSVEGYVYVALRAPNDTWNGFYDQYCCPLVANLIRQFVLFGEVNADKVFIMGYSHGGYGAFYLGPKMPDRFAAIHASAAAPTDGTISAKSLRNTRFTFMIGEKDTAYGRRERCEKFAAEIDKLRKDNPGDYPVAMEFQKGFGHGGLPDRDKIKGMYSFERNPVPKRLTWEPTDNQLRDFFWLSIEKPAKGQFIDVQAVANKVTIRADKVGPLTLWVDQRLVDARMPIELIVNGQASSQKLAPSLATLCKSIQRRGDLRLAASGRIDVSAKN